MAPASPRWVPTMSSWHAAGSTRSSTASRLLPTGSEKVSMPTKKITFDTVREIGMKFPGVEYGTAYGAPALKVHGKMFTCVPTHRSAEPGSLAIRLDFDQRDELIFSLLPVLVAGRSDLTAAFRGIGTQLSTSRPYRHTQSAPDGQPAL